MYKILNIYNRIGLIVLLLLCVFSCNNNLNTDAHIHGSWKGRYNDYEVSVVFNTDNTCAFKFIDKRSNNVEIINGYYELDFSKKPIPLSIRNIPQLNHPLHTIIEIIAEDSIRIAGFSPKWRLRPISFEAGKTINLYRTQSEECL